MIKSFLRNTRLWIVISNSDLYQKLRNPLAFKKDQEEVNFYSQLLAAINYPKELIFDVGANLGKKSAIFSKLSKKVIAFEPSENIFTYLQKRFKNSHVELFNCALGSTVSSSEFYEINGNEAYNSLSKKHIETTVTKREISNIELVTRRKVNVEIIENFIKKFGVPVYIKIDVEGYEYEVIKGLKTPVPLISFEANLPEFCDESINIIEYLSTISFDKYQFNFTSGNFLLLQNFANKDEAINFLLTTAYRYVEIYAKLEL